MPILIKHKSCGQPAGTVSLKNGGRTERLHWLTIPSSWNIDINFTGGGAGETAWHYTGLEDSGFLTLPDESAKGLTLGVSGDVVYAGKREGELFQSLDNGDTWNDITESFPFPFVYFKEIVFAGSTVYILTDAGVMRSLNGEVWHALTDTNGKMLLMDRIVADGLTLYGICDSGVYQVDNQTGTWKHIAPVPPHTVTSLAVDGDTFYIGTKHNGVFRLQRANQ